jgi:hypothetical protein
MRPEPVEDSHPTIVERIALTKTWEERRRR